MQKITSLSVFFPFWNEEKNIERVVNKALSILPKIAKKWELILVDDGSLDKTIEIAQKIAQSDDRIIIVSHKPNRGYGAALKEGIEKAKYDYVVFTDGDDQFDFSQVSQFIEKIRNADIAIGYRKKRNDASLAKRLLLMNLLKVWDFVLFGFHFKDIDCGFKMFSRHAIDEISPLRSEGAMITTEILAKAKKKKLKISQVGVAHYPRKFGKQSGANFPVIIRAVLESFVLFLDIRTSRF